MLIFKSFVMREQELRKKLRKIEAVFSSSNHSGERGAAKGAMERIKRSLSDIENAKYKEEVEFRFSLPNAWNRKLFISLCRKHKLRVYRYSNQRVSSVMIKAQKNFVEEILSPEFEALTEALEEYISPIIEKIIREEICNGHAKA
jgi:protein subunit release factor A